jgi:hypothetical protein
VSEPLAKVAVDVAATAAGYLVKVGVVVLRESGVDVPSWADELMGAVVGVGVRSIGRNLIDGWGPGLTAAA